MLFLGSTLGNFECPPDAKFLGELRVLLREGDLLLLGTDLLKPIPQLIAAYDDPLGVTAAFNRNLLARINRELGGDFELHNFEHSARFNRRTQSIEMHLRSLRRQTVNIARCDFSVTFLANETIWTESSHKYSREEVFAMAKQAGFECVGQWVDQEWPFNDKWYWHGMFAEYPLPPDWPVYVSQAEASAFARWISKSLPTESQFERAAFGTPEGGERDYPWGNQAPSHIHGNFNYQRWDPIPVGSHPAGESAFGVADLVGNGWQWTCTAFRSLPRFCAAPVDPGYSANFFDGKHFVLKGGSMMTDNTLLRRTFRNWFQAHYPFVYATFRCVEN